MLIGLTKLLFPQPNVFSWQINIDFYARVYKTRYSLNIATCAYVEINVFGNFFCSIIDRNY